MALRRDVDPDARFRTDGIEGRCALALADLTDHDALVRVLNEHEVDAVYHLAAQTIVGTANRSPLATWEANVRGTYTLLEACRGLGGVKRVVVASSDKAYGVQPRLPYSEDMPLQGRHPYDVSKSCADLLTQAYACTYQLPACITRCGNLYGGGDLNWNRLVPGTIRAALRGERPVIRSDGTLVRDYLYVEDAVLAYLSVAEQLAERRELSGQAFNFSYETQQTVLDFCRRILRSAGRQDLEPEVRAEVRHEIPHQYLDASRARSGLSWRPSFDLDEGLRRTVDWYRGFFEDAAR